MKLKEPEDDKQYRRLRLRSASWAPLRLRRLCVIHGYEGKQEHLTRVQTGNSVSPLDKTYHGGPRKFIWGSRLVNMTDMLTSQWASNTRAPE